MIISIKAERFASLSVLEFSGVVLAEKAPVFCSLVVSVRNSSAVAFFLYLLDPGVDKIFGVLVMGSVAIATLHNTGFFVCSAPGTLGFR